MEDKTKYTRRFRISVDKSWAFHIGLFFCLEPTWVDSNNVKRKGDCYLFIALGKYDVSIGMLTNEEDYE